MTEALQSIPAEESLYLPRSGEHIDGYIDILAHEPTNLLTEQERDQITRLEKQLLAGNVERGEGPHIRTGYTEQKSLPELIKGHDYRSKRREITADYLLTDAGKEYLAKHGLQQEFEDLQEAAHYVRAVCLSLDSGVLEGLARASEAYMDKVVTDALAEGIGIPDPTRVYVFEDVSNLMLRIGGLLSYRTFLQSVRQTLRSDNDGSNLAQAELAVVKIYQKYVNEQIAKLYPDVLHLWAQAAAMPESQRDVMQEAITLIHAPLATIGKRFVEQEHPSSIIRLDRLRNGASRGPEGYRAVSQGLMELFEQEDQQAEELLAPPIFTPEETAILDNIRFDPKQMQAFCQTILGHFGKLSAFEDAYDKTRPERAHDGKWQVPIVPKKDTTSLDAIDPPGYLRIPDNFNRTMTAINPPAGVLPVAAHEIAHVFQKDNIRSSGSLLLAQELGAGKRNSVLLETGSILVEQELQQRLFGRTRRDNPHYMRAMQVIDDGGGEMAATKAFYDSYRNYNPSAKSENAASIAISRTKRLVRRQGGYDSQALNYAETALLVEKTARLPQEIRNVLFAEGAFDISDLASLHRFGLAPRNPGVFPLDEYIAIVVPMCRELIQKERAAGEEDTSTVIG